MKYVGIFLMIASVFTGIYVGGWLCFVGGIVQIIDSLRAVPIVAQGVAYGVLRIMLTGFFGWITFGIFFFSGLEMYKLGSKREHRSRYY